MRIIYDRKEWNEEAVAATVGFFDGVHSGHRFLLQEMIDMAKERQLPSAIVTFPVHPRVVLHSDYQPKLLNSLDEKLALLSMEGIDYIIVMDFTQALAALSARQFITSVLASGWHVKTLLIGFDHQFGYQRTEGFDQYVGYGLTCGMEVVKVSSLNNDKGIAISSSIIRRLIETGDMVSVTRLLGYHYQLKGHVIDGHHVGRRLGFPTANIVVDEPNKVIPCHGSYAVWITIDCQQYKGMLYIGSRPTLGNDDVINIEANIFDFSGDIYNKPIAVEFVAFIREDRKFDSLDELKKQISKDKLKVINVLNK